MIYTKKDIAELGRVPKLKLINSITGIKPANLIGTIDEQGNSNLAVFSSIVHLGSNPALLGFISRPHKAAFGHTVRNIEGNGYYTINHIHPKIVKQAHYTSAKFEDGVSEFDKCKLTEEYIPEFKAPFVQESSFKMGLRLKEIIPIPSNGTVLVIGEVEHLCFPDSALIEGDIDLEIADGVGISGLNSYYSLKKIAQFPHVKVQEVPVF